MKKHLLFCFLIIVIGLLVYLNSLGNHFQFDDQRMLESIKSVPGIKNLFSLSPTSRMITNISFYLNYHYRLSRRTTFEFHLVNIFIHILTGILIYWIVFLMLRPDYSDKRPDYTDETASPFPIPHHPVTPSPSHLSLFTALLFVTHPLCTEPVNYIIARYSLLATMFSFLSLLFFILYLSPSPFTLSHLGRGEGEGTSPLAAESEPRLWWEGEGPMTPKRTGIGLLRRKRMRGKKFYLLGTVFSFLLAGYSKEIGFYYSLAMIFLYSVVFTDFLSKLRKKSLLLLFILLIGIFLFYISGGYYRLGTGEIDFGRYFLTENRVFLDYLRLMIFPLFGLNVDHHHLWAKNIFEISVFIPVLMNFFLLGFSFYLWKKGKFLSSRITCFSIFWIYLFLLPYFFFVSGELMVEYRSYPAIFGFVLLVAYAFEKFVRHKKLRLFIFSGIILMFSIATFRRNYDWKNPLTLWQDAAKKSPNKARVLTNLGNTYTLINNIDMAIEKYRQSLRMNPLAVETWTNLATAYCRKGQLDLAIETYKKALELDRRGDRKAKIYSNLGDIYSDKGMFEEAMETYNNALELNPRAYEVYWRRGILYHQKGLFNSALEEFEKAVAIYPEYPVGYNSLGIIYDLKGEYELAIKHYQKAIMLMPDYAEAYYNLGISYENKNLLDEAIQVYQEALRINPHYAKVYNNLGNIYYKKGEYEKAIENYRKAIIFDPTLVTAYNNLGTVYLEKKMYNEAEEIFKKILEIDPKNKEAKKNLQQTLEKISSK